MRGHLRFGIEAGTTIPADPVQYSSNWDPSRGIGAVLLYDLSPNVTTTLRYEYDVHDFNGSEYSTFGADQVIGSEAHFHGIWAGLRRQQTEGPLRAHVALYLGLAYREGRHATLIYPTHVDTYGESDQWVGGFGLGVGLTLKLEHLPDIYAEARLLWMEPEQQVPLRIGITIP